MCQLLTKALLSGERGSRLHRASRGNALVALASSCERLELVSQLPTKALLFGAADAHCLGCARLPRGKALVALVADHRLVHSEPLGLELARQLLTKASLFVLLVRRPCLRIALLAVACAAQLMAKLSSHWLDHRAAQP